MSLAKGDEHPLQLGRARLVRGILLALVILAAVPAVWGAWGRIEAGQPGLALLSFIDYPLLVVLLAIVNHLAQARHEAEARVQEVEQWRASTEAKLQDAQEFGALGLASAGVVHDLNNTLTVSISNIELSRMELEAGHPAQELLSDALDALHSSAGLTRQLLDVTRRRPPEEAVVVDIRPLVTRTIKLAGRLVPSTIELSTTVTEEPLPVQCAPTKVQQILLNLIFNARDAVGADGCIEVELGVGELDGRAAAQITVTDDGCGIDEDTREHIFEPLFTTKDENRGTGLGLWMVATIVRDCEGIIEVESAPDQGSRFTIKLPTTEGPLSSPSTPR